MFIELLRDNWHIFLSFLGAVVWGVRLESQGQSNKTEIDRLREQRREDLESGRESRENVAKVLDEIRQDIKQLIRDSGK
jgi:hypothetical protein